MSENKALEVLESLEKALNLIEFLSENKVQEVIEILKKATEEIVDVFTGDALTLPEATTEAPPVSEVEQQSPVAELDTPTPTETAGTEPLVDTEE